MAKTNAKSATLLTLLVSACSQTQPESGTAEKREAATSVQAVAKHEYRRYRVRTESAEARCRRRVVSLSSILAAKGHRGSGPVELKQARDQVLSATVGDERHYCFTPSGQVEFFHLARMEASAGPAPSHERFLAAAESVLAEMAEVGLVEQLQIERGSTKVAEVRTGYDDSENPSASSSETVGAKVSFRRTLDGLPVLRNFVTIGFDNALNVASLKLAWLDLDADGEAAHAQLSHDEATEKYLDFQQLHIKPLSAVGYLAGGLLETQQYLEPWYIFSVPGSGAPSFGVPAVENLAPLKGFGTVEATAQKRVTTR